MAVTQPLKRLILRGWRWAVWVEHKREQTLLVLPNSDYCWRVTKYAKLIVTQLIL